MNRNNLKRSRESCGDSNEPCAKKQKMTINIDSKDYCMFTSFVE